MAKVWGTIHFLIRIRHLYGEESSSRYFGLGEQVVLQLARKLQNSNVKIFCDNYFTSPALCMSILNVGIYFTGVVKANRKYMLEFRNDNLMSRGDIDVKSASNAPITSVKWVDNKGVHLLSSCDNGISTTM